jgi:hypothetical protein
MEFSYLYFERKTGFAGYVVHSGNITSIIVVDKPEGKMERFDVISMIMLKWMFRK